MLHTVLRRRARGEAEEDKDLIIPTGKRKGANPMARSALAEHARREAYPEAVAQTEAEFAAAAPRPKPAKIRMPEDPVTAEELELCQRLIAQRASPTAQDGSPHP
jgi:hypothetical protein